METVGSPPAEPELQLLTTWGQPDDADRRRTALIATALFHIAGIGILFLLPESFFQDKRMPEPVRHITPIFEPLTRLTQKQPNNAKSEKEFSVEDRGGRPHVTPPPSPTPGPVRAASPPPKPQPVRQAVIPQVTPPKPVQNTQPTPEPPKVDSALNAPKVTLPQLGTLPPPPQIQTQEEPKLALQNLGTAPPPVAPLEQRRIPLPDTSVDGAIHRSLESAPPRPPSPPPGADNGQSMQLPQLLSDAQGIDFTSYLRQILQTVKRNWQAVIPESVRMGRRGKVSVVLSIGRNGQIEKLVFSEQSGADSLDKAAVAGVSMSQPFPPLPAAFKGDKIVVQFNFAYNAPKQ